MQRKYIKRAVMEKVKEKYLLNGDLITMSTQRLH